MRTKQLFRLIFCALILLAVFGSFFLPGVSANGTGGPMAQVATSTAGYWKFVNATTFQQFTPPGQGSTWTPVFGDISNGGTVVSAYEGKPANSTTTQCSWSIAGGGKALTPGQTVQVTLAVKSSITGLNGKMSVSGGDDLEFVDFTGNNPTFTDDQYAANGLQTVTAQGAGSASFVVQPGWTGGTRVATRQMHFECTVASVGIAETTWHYEWVEGSAAPATESAPGEGTPAAPATGTIADLTGFLAAAGVAAAIIGALLVALGIAAILIDGNRKGDKPAPKPTGPRKNEPEPPQISYALNASASVVDVYPGEPASVTFTALRISEAGSAVAVDATVKVIMAGSEAGLEASPGSAEGILTCTFSVPTPRVCTTQDVLVVALVGGTARARTLVKVRILPKYELELQWNDPQQPALQVDGKEVLAWARVTATPPDPDATPDVLAQKIQVSLQGANIEWIRQPLAPYVQFEKQWNALAMVRPAGATEPGSGKPELVAEFSSGRQNLKARLAVEINQELVLGAWVNGKKEAQSIYQRNQTPPGWVLPDIIAYFHSRDNEEKPVKPSFNYGFDKPPFEATPAILDQVDFYENGDIPGQYVLKVALKPDTDLDAAFGGVPEDQRQLKVKVFARDENGKELPDFVTYTFRQMVSFVIHAYEANPTAAVREHAYRALKFPDGKSLVANGDDSLKLAGYFMRTDLLAKSGPDPAKRLDVGDLQGIEWKLPDDGNYFETSDPEVMDGFVLFNVKTRAPISASIVKNPEDPTSLIAKPELNLDEGSGYTLESDQVEVDIAVQYPRLHLWVVPGIYRHTSTVIAYLDLLPSKSPLPKQDVCLSVENPDGMMLDFDGCESHKETIDKDVEKTERRGGAFWKLRYSGITWDNMLQARFKVRAGLEDPPDESWTAWVQIDVHQNLLELLGDMTTNAAFSAKVNNPNRNFILPPTAEEIEEIKNNSSLDSPNIPIDEKLKAIINLADHYGKVLDGKTSTILKSSLPRFLRGPLYNIASCFKKYSFGEDYVCEKLRNGICVWLEQRRFLNDNEPPKGDVLRRLEKMNGIDFGYYSRTPFHVWAGIFPAGADRFSEYRALDPWWYQYWPNEWVQPENLWTQASEDMRLNIFTVLNWILKLAVICLYSEEQAQQFYEVVIAWLNGTTTDDILDKVIPNTGFRAWWRYVNFDSDNAGLDGRYATGRDPEHWSKDLFKDPDPD